MATEGMGWGVVFRAEGTACARPRSKRQTFDMFKKWLLVFMEQEEKGWRSGWGPAVS